MTIEQRQPASSRPLLDAARDLVPRIAAASDEIEQTRRLPAALVAALVDAGLFRMLVPASLGGPQANLLTFGAAIETVAAADGSTAWCLGQGAGSGFIAGFMDRHGARKIFDEPSAILAWGPGQGAAVIAEDGYRLSGHWPFASGCHHATWLGASARILRVDGHPHLRPDGRPEMRRLLFPAAQAQIVDVWQVSGLRGTGSDSYSVSDLYVPSELTVDAGPSGLPLQETRHEPGPLYAFPFTLVYGVAFASVALGIARGALDAFAALAGAKTRRGAEAPVREDPIVQSAVAHAEAGVRSARAFLHEAVRDAWADAGPVDAIPMRRRVVLRLAATHAIHAAAAAVDAVYHAAGATAIFTANPFERRFRDVHAVTQQGQGHQSHFREAGQYFLGVEPELGA